MGQERRRRRAAVIPTYTSVLDDALRGWRQRRDYDAVSRVLWPEPLDASGSDGRLGYRG